jgi:hypothetical protein
MRFFAWRGTVRGLQAALALALEEHVDPSLFDDVPSRCAQRSRIVELPATRHTGRTGGWTPDHGADALHARYLAALGTSSRTGATSFPLAPPADPEERAVWTDVALTELGFVPAAMDRRRWQDFLARRYAGPSALATAYQRAAEVPFQEIDVPGELPRVQAALVDWYDFQSVVLRRLASAHRFRLLLPVSVGTRSQGPRTAADLAGDAELARRVVELEKPAHTVFDVGFYWDAFRVGEARLGADTLVDLGSRAPALLAPAVLGVAHLGENVLPAPSVEGRVALADRGCTS